MPRRGSPYAGRYPRERARTLAPGARCVLRLVCDGAPATESDHDPPLALHRHVPGSGCCRLRRACGPCQRYQGGLIRAGRLTARPLPQASRTW